MPIHLLPQEVASQIAAGEVIERPASVVKELLENALDAEATRIVIKIEGAGQRLVEVADDGVGIPAAELGLAVARYATSKLQTAADLFSIATLGFRGEALASIGSVARLTMTSRPTTADIGMRIRVEGGQPGAMEPVGAPKGTVVRVEDLFYNVPARRKFLKHETTERRQIDALVIYYALAYPMVRFRLEQENRLSLQTSGSGSRREVLASLYGVDVAKGMLEVLSEEDGLQVTGFISPISLTRSNRREIHFFVNGRPVQDSTLSSAVVQAYRTLIMVGRFPIGILFIDVPADWVDVNVHPAKAEVRFRDAGKIFSAVQRAVRRALLAHTPIPELEGSQIQWPSPVDRQQAIDPMTASHEEAPGKQGLNAYVQGSAMDTQPVIQPPSLQPLIKNPILRLVGQIASAYLVAEGPDGLYLIDQHAAHERILFERLLAQLEASAHGQAVPSQALLGPVSVNLPPSSARLLSEQLPLLDRLGFRVEPFGPGAFIVRALPLLLTGVDPASALLVVVEDFEEDETPLQAEIEARLISRVCKRAAVKAGKTLSLEEQHALLSDLEACKSPRTCPHGRPTMIHLSVDLLERQFGRKGPR